MVYNATIQMKLNKLWIKFLNNCDYVFIIIIKNIILCVIIYNKNCTQVREAIAMYSN